MYRNIIARSILPGRYTGGESGTITQDYHDAYHMAISFPDLYEIGMSNNAVRIIYNLCNTIAPSDADLSSDATPENATPIKSDPLLGAPPKHANPQGQVVCERVFSPAPDFESLLKEHNEPLRTLEFQRPLHQLDLLAFTVGYELSATNILAILDCGGIPLRAQEREEQDPIVIGGGPALTNPIPLGPFFDAIYIGEAEEILQELIQGLRTLKNQGATRAAMADWLKTSPYIWYEGKESPTKRAVFQRFSEGIIPRYYPVPHIETAQNHGVVEVMRGCPNGCRFCQAGYFYRPLREKHIAAIIREIDFLVYTCGYQSITLTSLSTGDYSLLQELFTLIHDRYSEEKITFSLPSLKVNSFTLDLMQELSKVKKSGLTFAVETPLELWQRGINKEVSFDQVVAILQEAKRLGWNLAKFYFMIGLPTAPSVADEAKEIVTYIKQLREAIKIGIHINIGTFIPKPHTPYQWAPQLGKESARILRDVKEQLKQPGIKISYHDPFVSYLEGVVARGDHRVASFIEKAYNQGARLDAWSEYFRKDIWESLLEDHAELDAIVTAPRSTQDLLPWGSIEIGPTTNYFADELEASKNGLLTAPCGVPCPSYCGVCTAKEPIQYAKPPVATAPVASPILSANSATSMASIVSDVASPVVAATPWATEDLKLPPKPRVAIEAMQKVRIIARFSKQDRAIYLSHINVMHLFERAIFRMGAVPLYTQGYTPKPRIEFASPLSLGISSQVEAVSIYCYLPMSFDTNQVITQFSTALPEGLFLTECLLLPGEYKENEKIIKLTPNYAGSSYTITHPNGTVSIAESYSTGKDQPKNPLKPAIEASGLDKIEFLATHQVVRKSLHFALAPSNRLLDLFELFNA